MTKYKVLTPLRTDDNTVHQPGEVIDLSDNEAQSALSFKAVEKVKEEVLADSKPAPAKPSTPTPSAPTSAPDQAASTQALADKKAADGK